MEMHHCDIILILRKNNHTHRTERQNKMNNITGVMLSVDIGNVITYSPYNASFEIFLLSAGVFDVTAV